MKKRRIVLVVLAVILFSVLCCLLINKLGLDDITKLRKIVNNGFGGMIIYIVLLALQVAFLPVNSLILIVPAIVLFGSSKAFILSLIGCVIGSIISFFIGKCFGSQVMGWMMGEEKVKEFEEKLSNAHILLPIFLLVPIFPDEIMCVAAGAAKVKTLFFIITIIITRAIDLFFTCFVGASIPFEGWYLLLWALIILLGVFCVYLLTKHQKRIVEFFTKNLKNRQKRKMF